MDILKYTEHRTFPYPSRWWVMRQKWRNVSFIHWPVSQKALRAIIPQSLEIDTYHHQAWIGIVIFEMESIHIRGMSSFSLTPSFPEINIRTYVSHKGIPGIYMIDIDVDNWMTAKAAKTLFRMPYHMANISIEKSTNAFHYESSRLINPAIKGEGFITPISDIYVSDKDSLDYWLMERYRLYHVKNGKVYKADIHHQAWELQKAEAKIHKNTQLSSLKLGINEHVPVVSHFSVGVDPVLWNIKRAK